MGRPTHSSRSALRAFARRDGFALLVTVVLVAFLVLILVGLATFVRVETQVAANAGELSKARQNALFALNLAMGKLQQAAGPDQRVTAAAEIVAGTNATKRKWTGAWDTTNPTAAPTWLVSGVAPSATTASPTLTGVDYDTSAVRLVGDATTDPATAGNEIVVPLEEIRANGIPGFADVAGGSLTGRYAFWVGDEGVKARANLGDEIGAKSSPDFSDVMNRASLAQRSAVEWQRTGSGTAILGDYVPAASLASLDRVIAGEQFVFTAPDSASATALRTGQRARFHDLTFSSAGVEADTRLGGLKRDLTAAFEMTDADFQTSTFANGATTRISMAPAGNANYVSPIWSFDKDSDGATLTTTGTGGFFRGPTWHLFRNHYRLYREASAAAGGIATTPVFRARTALPNNSWSQGTNRLPEPYLDVFNKTTPDAKVTDQRTDGMRIPRETSPALMPYLHRVSYIISMQTVPATSLPADAGTHASGLYEVRLVVTPYVVLHNPYNVAVELSNFGLSTTAPSGDTPPGGAWARLELRGLPFSQLVKVRTPAGVTHEYHRSTKSTGDTLENRATPMMIAAINAVPTMGYQAFASVYIPANITLAPGELKVFSPAGSTTSPIAKRLLLEENKNVRGGYYFNQLNGGFNKGTGGNDWFGGWPAGTGGADKAVQNPIGDDYAQIAPTTTDDYRIIVTGDTDVSLAMTDCNIGDNGLIVRYYPASYSGDTSLDDGRMPLHAEMFYRNTTTVGGSDQTRARNYSDYDQWWKSGGSAAFSEPAQASSYASSVPTPLFAFDLFLKPGDHDTAKAARAFVQNNPMAVVADKNAEGSYPSQGGKTGYPRGADAWQSQYRRLEGGVGSWTTDLFDAEPSTGRAYWGPSNEQADGVTQASLIEVPVSPMTSIAQFQHLMISRFANQPYFAVGNSEASPYVDPRHKISNVRRGADSWIVGDMSFLANEALWDSSYFSTLAPGFDATANAFYTGGVAGNALSRESVRTAWMSGTRSLPNTRVAPWWSPNRTAANTRAAVLDPNLAATAMLMEGAFNVNSLSVEAWVAVLGGARRAAIAKLGGGSESVGDNVGFPHALPAAGSERGGGPTAVWNGFARLDPNEIRTIATELVAQIRARQLAKGRPFLSLGEFVNRSLTTDVYGRRGALQAAIDAAGVNGVSLGGEEVTSTLQSTAGYPFPDNGTGNTAAAAAGWVRQADVLQQIGPFLSARSDTFLVRTYGECVNPANDGTTARAWCEAVVQRVPDFVDQSDPALAAVYPGSTLAAGSAAAIGTVNATNARFGRRFQIVSFRWLTPDDI